jgi:hypothetical protein|tara:strand:+ start:145 stop:360 length:216 start_codon:yes stop_codon:yes gene_type:complete
MGQSKDEFMNCRMSVDHYREIPPEYRGEIEVKTIDVENYDYSTSDLWTAQKKKADKEFRTLKKIEFEIRNK